MDPKVGAYLNSMLQRFVAGRQQADVDNYLGAVHSHNQQLRSQLQQVRGQSTWGSQPQPQFGVDNASRAPSQGMQMDQVNTSPAFGDGMPQQTAPQPQWGAQRGPSQMGVQRGPTNGQKVWKQLKDMGGMSNQRSHGMRRNGVNRPF